MISPSNATITIILFSIIYIYINFCGFSHIVIRLDIECNSLEVFPFLKLKMNPTCCCSVTKSRLTLSSPVNYIAHQVPLSMGFSRQEYWRGLPFPSPGDLSDPGIELRSPPLQADSLTPEH